MSKPISKPNMAETQHSSNQFVEINRIVSNHILEQLKVELTELKGDTDPKIFLDLSCVNKYYGRGFRLQAYEKIVDRTSTFFREYCTPAWYPNNVIEQSLDVSGYDGSEGNLKLKTELINVFVLTSVKDTINAKYNALKNHCGPGDDLYGFGVAKFRRWMTKNDQNDAPPPRAMIVILSFINNIRNPKNKDEEEYKRGRVTAMCFALLLTEELTKVGGLEQNESYIKILGAAMIHALTTHAKGSGPLWEHICDVIYPPEQHKEKTVLFDYVAACTMGDHHVNFSVCNRFYLPSCSCLSGCVCNEIHVSAVDALEFFLNNDVTESVRKWEKDHSTTLTN